MHYEDRGRVFRSEGQYTSVESVVSASPEADQAAPDGSGNGHGDGAGKGGAFETGSEGGFGLLMW